MEGTENLGFNLPALLIQIISFLVILGLLYFAAYRPIMRRANKRLQEAKDKEEQLEKELLNNTEQGIDRYTGEAKKQRQEIINRIKQVEEEARQKAQGENERTLEAIINKARAEIGRERDEAIGEVRQEYNNIFIPNTNNSASHKGE
jgi:F-type H+-transporting ATPase subunit b